MKKARKALLTLCAALLLVSVTAGVTIAYLTDTESVKNTFTVGNVQIKLDEAVAEYNKDENKWEATEERTEEGQQYKILPGVVIDKDPTVSVVEGSEDALIRAKVTVTYQQAAETVLADAETWISGWGEGWEIVTDYPVTTKDDTAKTVSRTYEVRYANVVNEDSDIPAVFTTITIPGEEIGTLQLPLLEGMTIDVVAEAIQADGFTSTVGGVVTPDLDAAWEAFGE